MFHRQAFKYIDEDAQRDLARIWIRRALYSYVLPAFVSLGTHPKTVEVLSSSYSEKMGDEIRFLLERMELAMLQDEWDTHESRLTETGSAKAALKLAAHAAEAALRTHIHMGTVQRLINQSVSKALRCSVLRDLSPDFKDMPVGADEWYLDFEIQVDLAKEKLQQVREIMDRLPRERADDAREELKKVLDAYEG